MKIIDEYFKYHTKYADQYGHEKTIILMQVGKFYEAYSTNEIGPDLLKISKEINVMRSQKNKQIAKIDTDNPYFLGFPTVSLIKFLELLVETYTVVVIDQMGTDPKSTKKREMREVTGIYSKGTFIENIENKDTKFIVAVYITEEKQKSGKPLMCCGLSAVDLSTSKVFIHEAYSTSIDTNFALDEVARFITSLHPEELILYHNSKDKSFTKDDLISYLEIDKNKCRYIDTIDTKYSKITFQNELLKKAYPNDKSLIHPLEYLDLNDKIYATISLTLLLDFVYDKNKHLLDNLSKPICYLGSGHLTLGNNAIHQLNIITDKSDESTQYKSLFHVVNCTSTPMGERYLKSILVSPLIDQTELNKIYDMTDEMCYKKFWLSVETHLDTIKDLERLERKLGLLLLRPIELVMLVNSYESVCQVFKIISSQKKAPMLQTLLPKSKDIKKIQEMIDDVKKTFDFDELNKYAVLEFKTSIFNPKIHSDLDALRDSVDQGLTLMGQLKNTLVDMLDIGIGKNKAIGIKNNNRDGYYLTLTTARAKILKSKLDKLKNITVNEKEINTDILIFKDTGKTTKIYFKTLGQKADDISQFLEQLDDLTKKHYLEYLTYFYNKYLSLIDQCNQSITQIDYLKSCSKLVSLYNYVRPTISNKKYGSVDATGLRHPIVERIIDYDYVAHDIKIGHDGLKGMLIYGLNSSGKSVMMKSIGLSIIMAQSGLFVPAKSFTFSPYHSLYTRITGNDNIFKGLSSFALEMMELNSILKRADEKTLVIGDEVCRGTEHISGNALVATTIIKLSKALSTFIFATHLHEISTLDEITSLPNVKSFHLKVDYDAKTDRLIYNRTLNEGSGEPIYGITVARHIIHDLDFIDCAIGIKNKLMKRYDSMITGKLSSYNKKVYVHECHVCGKQDSISHISPLETHHINFQKDCVNGFVKDKQHIKKDQESNLVVLCTECHDKIHNGKLIINGYVMTSKGKTIIMSNKESEDEKPQKVLKSNNKSKK